jgi:hypothetical protein
LSENTVNAKPRPLGSPVERRGVATLAGDCGEAGVMSISLGGYGPCHFERPASGTRQSIVKENDMNFDSMGAWLPVWIIGAPFVLAIIDWMFDPEGGAALIDYLTTADVQAQVLNELGFFPVVDGVDTSNLPEGIAIEAEAVNTQATSADALPALLPVGLGERGGEINQIYRNAFDRVVLDGEDVQTVLNEEGANLQTLMDETGAPCWAPDAPSEGPCQVE